MSSTRKALVFRQYVEQAFEAAAQDFKDDPSANNWLDLKVAMWAWQHVHGIERPGVGKEDSLRCLNDAAHTYLRGVAARAKGDNNFQGGE
jgi:hypothetical protein